MLYFLRYFFSTQQNRKQIWDYNLNQIMNQVARLQDQIEKEVAKFNELTKKAQQYVQARNSLFEQQSENSLVLSQINMIPDGAKIYKQVGGVLIDQTKKQAVNTLSQRVGHINSQIESTSELIKKNETEQKAMSEKIQKAKAYYTNMVQSLQGKS